ncbi:hypothetical protein SAMN04488068_1964 [Hydrocarboniphaga daqingensis]|uniref:Winged helix DNA-binding domain-containing protein n=1 Tax=Hydrocarboniphaga daqingensis TaxID=490188 RepID=A0A1M5P0V3_9GAMM|nr:hypothetical protein [Hydrocarboniphaga daqingensis]SHG95402.1 hypothetical protein SAMN04488068_1964 [Hydrocarboniphaga daqingensis]
MRTQLIDDDACNDILHWLDAHSVTLSQGLPAALLHQRWAEAGREPAALGQALQTLLARDWVAVTPGSNPPHLRFTVEGFRRLIAAPTPDAAAATVPAAAALPASDADAVPTPSATDRAHTSELLLRNDILGIYGDLRLKAEARLIGMTLSRYWQEMGHRAGELRTGLDVLVRDGLLASRLIGIDRYWQLTREGEAWLRGGRSHRALLKLAPALGDVRPGPNAEDAQRLVARLAATLPTPLSYAALQSSWAYSTSFDDNLLLSGLDLMLRHDHATLAGPDEAPLLTLTDAGRAYAAEDVPRFAKLLATLNRVLN